MNLLHTIASQRRRSDPDADAYISAVDAAKGSAMTGTQRAALQAFVTAEKTAGRWGALRRLYLPVWGSAAANSICLVSQLSGTFAGAITHESGYVSARVNGHFDTGVDITALGMTENTGWIGRLATYNAANGQEGALLSASQSALLIFLATGQLRSEYAGSSNRYDVLPAVASTGIFSSTRLSGATRLRLRRQSGRESWDFGQAAGTTATGLNFFFLGRNRTSGIPDQLLNSDAGAYWLGLGVADADDAAFTASLKTLWETLTGLTLP
jgi:hypothetical protein